MNLKVSCAVGAILGAYAAAALADGQATPASQPGAAAEEGISEVIVTAQRRAESIQDVPITIQALTSETLTQLNVENFDEFVKYLPNVTQSTNGPARGDVFMRGLSVGGGGGEGGGTTAAFPAVAIYLDEQSGSSRVATSTSMRPTSNASRCSRVRRARCSAAAR